MNALSEKIAKYLVFTSKYTESLALNNVYDVIYVYPIENEIG